MGTWSSKPNNTETNLIQDQKNIITLQQLENNILKNIIYSQIKNPKFLDLDIINNLNNSRINKNYNYLVLSGGGIKTISICGALTQLESLNIFPNKFIGFAGTSGGAILAGLLAVGYQPAELLDLIKNLDTNKIFYDNLSIFSDTYNFFKYYGLCPGKYLMELLGNLIGKKTGNPDYTINQLYSEKKIKFVTVATNLSNKSSEYFYPNNNKPEYNNMPIRLAIRFSVGIPFIFEPYIYNGDYFVDGGYLDNYLIHVFDGDYPGDLKSRLNLVNPNPEVLGIKIITAEDNLNYGDSKKYNITNMSTYALSFLETICAENDKRLMVPSFWLRTIFIITPNYSLITANISDQEKNKLVELGRDYTNNFFTDQNLINIF